MDIQGKTALVTGGASGLGEATARALIDAGANVAIMDLAEEKGAKLAQELGPRAFFVKTDVANEEEVAAGIDKVVKHFGALHIVANNAGIARPRLVIGKDGPTSLKDFTDVLDVDLIAAYNVLRLSAWIMSQQDPVNEDGERGVIINTSSVAAEHGQKGQQSYSAAKGGLDSLALPSARALARNGIRVAGIAPGLFLTPIYGGNQAFIEEMEKNCIFPRRMGKPEEFASFFLEVVRNPMINGDTIRLDGGVRF